MYVYSLVHHATELKCTIHYIFSNFPNRVPKPTSYLTGNAKSLEFEWSIQLNSNILGMFKVDLKSKRVYG